MEEIDQDGIKFLEKKALISFLKQHDEKSILQAMFGQDAVIKSVLLQFKEKI